MRQLSMLELQRLEPEDYKKTEKVKVTVLLDNIRSAYNVGSIFRTCDAFLIEKIILTGYTPQPPHPEIRKTALGATESVEWEFIKNPQEAINHLKSAGYHIIAVEQTDTPTLLHRWQPEEEKKYALILGNEVKGVQQDLLSLCDFAIEIPQSGTKHSLNVAVAAGMVLWKCYENFLEHQR